MKKVIAILLFIGSVFQINAQNFDDSLIFQNQSIVKPMEFTFETGTSFIHSAYFGNSNNVFIAPGLKLNATPKLTFSVKTIMNYPTFVGNAAYNDGFNNSVDHNQQYVSLMAVGEYKFNEKLHFRGYYYKNSGSQPGFYNPYLTNSYLNPMYNNIQNAISVGLMYKLTENISIGAEFRSVELRTGPYYYFPY